MLSPEESHHAGSVLRCRVGDPVWLFDGEGAEAVGRVAQIRRQAVTIDVGEVREPQVSERVRLTLAVAMPRKQRQGFVFEKCTELGVWAIWPMVCTRSVVKPAPDRMARWHRTTVEAAKQCGRCRLPRVEAVMQFAETLERAAEFDACVVTGADPAAGPLKDVLAECRARIEEAGVWSLLVWIGPEGGLTAEEVESAVGVGATRASLGDSVLRVETAAVAVAALVGLG